MDRLPRYSSDTPGTWIEGEGTAVFVPYGYEPNYAYPTVVWLESSTGVATGARRCFPQASDRNCIVISLMPPLPPAMNGRCGEWRLGADDVWEAIDYVGTAVAEVASEMNVHPGRVYLAGEGDGAAMACDLIAIQPEKYAGAIAINPTGAFASASLHDWRESRGRPVLLICDSETSAARTSLRRYRRNLEVLTGIDPEALPSLLIRWIMAQIPSSSAMT